MRSQAGGAARKPGAAAHQQHLGLRAQAVRDEPRAARGGAVGGECAGQHLREEELPIELQQPRVVTVGRVGVRGGRGR
eukprot:4109964-Prymnesium_polylepis.1